MLEIIKLEDLSIRQLSTVLQASGLIKFIDNSHVSELSDLEFIVVNNIEKGIIAVVELEYIHDMYDSLEASDSEVDKLLMSNGRENSFRLIDILNLPLFKNYTRLRAQLESRLDKLEEVLY